MTPPSVETATTIAGVVVALAALVVAIGVLAKSPYVGKPLRWLWQHNVSDPFAGWLTLVVRNVVDERIGHLMKHNNGGSSLKDLADSQKILTRHVETLLEHDKLRDVEGKRYHDPSVGD